MKKNNKEEVILIRVTADEKEKIAKVAREMGLSTSGFMRMLFNQHVERKKKG